MKIILLENVRKVGSIGDVIDVKRGFARNYLISKKKALFASKENIKEVEKIKQELNKKGNYIHFKIKADGKIISELEKNEKIDKNLLRYLTVKVKKFDLETDYFKKNVDKEVDKKPKYNYEKKK